MDDLRAVAEGLNKDELAALEAAGVSLVGSPSDPTGELAEARGRAAVEAFWAESLTFEEVEVLLAVPVDVVEAKAAARELALVAGGVGAGLRLARWQFVGSTVLPGLVEVLGAAGPIHPIALANWAQRADVDLVRGGRPMSPVEWLASGGDVQVVAELAVCASAQG